MEVLGTQAFRLYNPMEAWREKESLIGAVARVRLVKIPQAGKCLAVCVVICEMWWLAMDL
jgi:hypothetical protein